MDAMLTFLGKRWRDIRHGRRARWYTGLRWRVGRLFSPRYRMDMVDTGLGHGWHDCDDVLLHASFAVLCRYVEWEQGGFDPLSGRFKAPITVEDTDYDDEAKRLYRWWKVDRPAALAAIHAMLRDESRWSEMQKREEALRDAETDALCRLARIRGGLWT